MQQQIQVNVYGGFAIWFKGYAFIEGYPSYIHVGSGSQSGSVQVSFEVMSAEPYADKDKWDHIAECSLRLTSPLITIGGDDGANYDNPDDYHTIEIMPGNYRMRICWGGLNTVAQDNYFRKGQDFYQITLWPEEEHHEPAVMKQYPRR